MAFRKSTGIKIRALTNIKIDDNRSTTMQNKHETNFENTKEQLNATSPENNLSGKKKVKITAIRKRKPLNTLFRRLPSTKRVRPKFPLRPSREKFSWDKGFSLRATLSKIITAAARF